MFPFGSQTRIISNKRVANYTRRYCGLIEPTRSDQGQLSDEMTYLFQILFGLVTSLQERDEMFLNQTASHFNCERFDLHC
jgi:hypothetical protein